MPARFAANLRLDRLTRNDVHAAILLGGLGLLTAFSGWLLWSWAGVLAALTSLAAIAHFAPRLPPEAIMRLYRAKPIDPAHGGQILQVVDVLSARAGLAAAPAVYVVASMTVNAFAAGTPQKAAIAVTEGLLRRLSLRELTGVLGHEVEPHRQQRSGCHEPGRRHDALHPGAVLSRNLSCHFQPAGPAPGDSDVSLRALLLLYLAPMIGSLLQLALARAREFDADRAGASLTGDPAGLAAALNRIERVQGTLWEDMMLPVPGRRIPAPSVLRTHPPTEERIERLRTARGRPPATADRCPRRADAFPRRRRPGRYAPAPALSRRLVLVVVWP